MHSENIARSNILAIIFNNDYRWLKDKLRRKVFNKDDAEDIASEAFVRLAAFPDLLNVKQPRAMLTTLAHRVLYESWRRRDLERTYNKILLDTPLATHPSAEDKESILETLLLIDASLDGLSLKTRKAFLMNQLDGMTYAEIAIHLNVSVSMVRKYMASALKNCHSVYNNDK